MKSIVAVNINIPTIKDFIEYDSDGSLRDYDIIIFNPKIPYYRRIEFTGGGSCLSIEGGRQFTRSSAHWLQELQVALSAGKTVFVVMSARETDYAAVSSSMTSKSQRTYQTTIIDSYSAIPAALKVRNSNGKGIIVKDSIFSGLYNSIKQIMEYRVVIEKNENFKTDFTAKDGAPIGGTMRYKSGLGHLVLVPFFDFEIEEFYGASDEGGEDWNRKALSASNGLISQLVHIDRALIGSREMTPPPDWLDGLVRPKDVKAMEEAIAKIDEQITEFRQEREKHLSHKTEILEYTHLLYEKGNLLERAIEKTLKLLGYAVDTLRIGDLEIDHVIVGPSGKRMIGESEGKDSSAIDITKFRQLESNIGEDFEREQVDQPAKGLLFGNGYRLSAPEERPEQFTQKSLTNAGRLGSALIRTTDLYAVAVYLLDHPEDTDFKEACRNAIEETKGGIVTFPDPVK